MSMRPLAATLVLLAITSDTAAQSQARDPSALALQGVGYLDTREFARALESFTEAALALPGDASLNLGAGVAAFMTGDHAAAKRWLEAALDLDPHNLTASEWLGELHYRAGRLDEAIAVYQEALSDPIRSSGSDALGHRLAGWRRERELQMTFAEIAGARVSVRFRFTDEALAADILVRLEGAYQRVGEMLGAYPSQPVVVLLYTLDEFQAITRLPRWTVAAYDGRIRLPLSGVPADVEELDRVLTHELVHAVVSTLAGRNTPAWLNEGLALVLEPSGPAALEAVLDENRRWPSLARLHDSFLQMDTEEAQLAYAVSARAVTRMTSLAGTPAVVQLLRDLGQGISFDRAFEQRLSLEYREFQAALARP
jgi:tetratricopeptide (TPR) repeat protein